MVIENVLCLEEKITGAANRYRMGENYQTYPAAQGKGMKFVNTQREGLAEWSSRTPFNNRICGAELSRIKYPVEIKRSLCSKVQIMYYPEFVLEESFR